MTAGSSEFSSPIRQRGETRGIVVALATIGIVCLFLFPIPRALLDILLAINLTLSLILLIRGLLLTEATQLFAFPIILLLSTLFRLGLNVSSTRLILLNGEQGLDAAGHVIQAFGEFVVQGDFLVGAIVFSVIALVNFIVITRGAARVAEVSARFSLDALPGKQLAIDADLRAGNITREEAERRRGALQKESNFYGAMDGAMRFVQGDAIACLAIVIINVVGGAILGISRGMEVEDAIKRFGVLSIGDGLVSILPALLVSVCSGVVVTNVSRGRQVTVSRQVLQTVLSDQLALLLAGLAAIIFSFLPGFPFLPFTIVGVVCILLAIRPEVLSRFFSRLRFSTAGRGSNTFFRSLELSTLGSPESSDYDGMLLDRPSPARLSFQSRPDLNSVTLEISERDAELLGGVASIESNYRDERARFFEQRGIPLLSIRTLVSHSHINARIGVIQYRVYVRGRIVREGSCLARQAFVRAVPGRVLSIGAEMRAIGRDPVMGSSGVWIESDDKLERALSALGLEYIDASRYLALDCVSVQLRHLDELFGVDETKEILSQLSDIAPRLVEEIQSPAFLTPFELCSLFRSLIRSRISVRDSKLILDGILEFSSLEPLPPPEQGSGRAAWLEECGKSLRRKLKGVILDDIVGNSEDLRVFLINNELAEEFRESASHWDDRSLPLPIEPKRAQEIRRIIGRLFTPVVERGQLPAVILCDGDIREAVDEFLSSQRFALPGLGEEFTGNEWYRTVSFDEVGNRQKIETVGVLQG